MDGRSAGGYRASLDRLVSAQKPAAGTPLYSRLVNRPLGRRIAALVHGWGWTPNGVTLVSAGFTLAGVLLIALVPPVWWLGFGVAALLIVGYALDSADGQLARLRGGGSVQGEWLDHTVDAAKLLTIHTAILIAAFRFLDLPPAWLLVPIAYLVVDCLFFFAMMQRDLLLARESGGQAPPSQASTGALRAILILPSDYGFFCLICVLWGFPLVFFGAYTVMLVGNAGILLLALSKWYRQLGASAR